MALELLATLHLRTHAVHRSMMQEAGTINTAEIMLHALGIHMFAHRSEQDRNAQMRNCNA